MNRPDKLALLGSPEGTPPSPPANIYPLHRVVFAEELQAERTFAVSENEFVTEREVFWNGFGFGAVAGCLFTVVAAYFVAFAL